MFNFSNFHDETIAEFTLCDQPERPADFVSPSGSAYWNEPEGVIRQSDHWAGQHGCHSQKSCVWSLSADIG